MTSIYEPETQEYLPYDIIAATDDVILFVVSVVGGGWGGCQEDVVPATGSLPRGRLLRGVMT